MSSQESMKSTSAPGSPERISSWRGVSSMSLLYELFNVFGCRYAAISPEPALCKGNLRGLSLNSKATKRATAPSTHLSRMILDCKTWPSMPPSPPLLSPEWPLDCCDSVARYLKTIFVVMVFPAPLSPLTRMDWSPPTSPEQLSSNDLIMARNAASATPKA